MMTGEERTNGSGAAAILAAGVGALALGVLAVAGDKSAVMKGWMIFYRPTGPLSGVTTVAILIWLGCWGLLEWRWGKRSVAVGRVCWVALVLLGVGVLLTFPPVGDLF
jgi:peptidoglycan biosynthesis protein MviN/MurJ (putative lipid II flippase)